MLCFLHFNKAGGNTFVNIAKQNCKLRPSVVDGLVVEALNPKEPLSLDNWKPVYWWLLSKKDRYKYTQNKKYDMIVVEVGPGDSPHSFCKTLFKELDYVTILRDPLDMLFSRYNHLSMIGQVSDLPVKDWLLSHPNPNIMTTVLSNNWKKPNLEKAKKNLWNLAGLMTIDTFEFDIQVMNRKFGWNSLDINHYRAGTNHGSNVRLFFREDPTFIKELESRHSLDLELYKYALSVKDEINK